MTSGQSVGGLPAVTTNAFDPSLEHIRDALTQVTNLCPVANNSIYASLTIGHYTFSV